MASWHHHYIEMNGKPQKSEAQKTCSTGEFTCTAATLIVIKVISYIVQHFNVARGVGKRKGTTS